MSNPWFRLYAEFMHDPKVQVLTEALQRRYVMVLCMQCSEYFEKRPDDEIALSLRITVEDWLVTKEEFIKRGLMLPSGKINGWEKRQFISDIADPTAAARQKRYRESRRNNRNATVTLRLPESDTESDTDTDTEQKQSKLKTSAAFALPEWVDKSVWDLWMQTRKGKKMIPAQMQAQVNKLQAWKDSGIDYAGALSASAEAGWSGLFEPKPLRSGVVSSQSENLQIREAARKRLFGEQEIETI